MNKKIYKSLMVKSKTHKTIIVEAKKNDMTVDQFLTLLAQMWEDNIKNNG